MAISESAKLKIGELVRKIPLPSIDIKVFGSERVNIHITVESRSTAIKWDTTLREFCSTVKTVETIIYNKKNMGTNLQPSRRKGYLIGAVV
jgi:hypothetical protein